MRSTPRKYNLAGRKFDRLTAVDPDYAEDGYAGWRCDCDCGGTIVVRTTELLSGYGKSCGCIRKPNRVGDVYGKLTVLSNDDTNKSYWHCRCECGRVTKVTGVHLGSGHTKSCGSCTDRRGKPLPKRRRPPGMAVANGIFCQYRRRARQRGWRFDLDTDQFLWFCKQNCSYCGAPPRGLADGKWCTFSYNGIDRIDSLRGYEFGNILPCCKVCNASKNDHDPMAFLVRHKAVYEHLGLADGVEAAMTRIQQKADDPLPSTDGDDVEVWPTGVGL